jgi:hypothetical protein
VTSYTHTYASINVIAVATEELEKVFSRVQPIIFSCVVPPDTTHDLVEVIRAKVSVVSGTSNIRICCK